MRRLPFLLLGLTGCMCPPPIPAVDAGVDPDAGELGSLTFTLEPMGAVLRGDAVERPGTFKNTSAEAVEVREIAVSGSAFSLLGPSGLTVPALGEATLQVRFAPAVLGPHAGLLTFQAPTPQSHPLLGMSIGPALALSPLQLDLGTVPLYAGAPATASASLDVRNSGLDTNPPRPDPTLQVIFDVQSTSDALPEELCVGDCTGAPVRLAVNQGSTQAVTLTTTTPGLKTWDVRVFSNDPDQPMRTVPVTANVVTRPLCQFAVPAGLSFGVLTAPEQRELELVFENVGTEVCEVSAVDLGAETPAQSPPFFSLVNPPAGLQTIAPGELLRVTVRADATLDVPAPARGEVAGELRFEVNHPDRFARVPLTAQPRLTCLVVTPSPVDFATVQTSCRSADRTVTLRNRCSSPVVVSAAALPGFSAFSVSAQVPTSLAAGASMTLTTRYAPVTVGPARDVINVNWAGPNGASLTTISLLGEAGVSGQNTDRFGPRSTRLDVLLALADSSGMADKQATLRAQLPGLITALQNLNVDFRIGVITAEPTGGALRRTSTGARWITSVMPALQTRFTELTAFTGNQGTAAACEEPILRALTAPYRSDPMLNGGFLRPDALLSVLCVTDTSDVALRVGELLQVKGPGGVRVDVIGPVAPSTAQCSTAWVSSLPGHLTYTQQTGGRVLDVCAADWTPIFVEVAAQTVARPFFPLRAVPDLSGTPIEVRVDGLNVSPATDGGTAIWVYESGPNAVRFPPLSAPLATAPVEISYPVPCAP